MSREWEGVRLYVKWTVVDTTRMSEADWDYFFSERGVDAMCPHNSASNIRATDEVFCNGLFGHDGLHGDQIRNLELDGLEPRSLTRPFHHSDLGGATPA